NDAGDGVGVRHEVEGLGLLADTEVGVGPLPRLFRQAVGKRVRLDVSGGGAEAYDLPPARVEAVEGPAGARLDVSRVVVLFKVIHAAAAAEGGIVNGHLMPTVTGAGSGHDPVLVGGRAPAGEHLGAELVLARPVQAQHEPVGAARGHTPVG